MPWGPRTAETSINIAEGDKLYLFGVYSGPSGLLSAFSPVFKDFSDAAEYNNILTATKLTNFSGGFPPGFSATTNTPQSAGKVTIGGQFNSDTANPLPLGVYSPTNPTDRPSTGEVVRIMRFGATPVQISAGFVPNVGDYIVALPNSVLAGTAPGATGVQPSNGYLGRVLATGAGISVGAAATLGAGSFGFLINGYMDK